MKQKFTLIELLVVISIIGILTSILLPALAKARVKVRTTACINNNKQIGTAMMVYTTDEDDYFPATFNKISFDDQLSGYDGRNLTQAEINQDPLPLKYEYSLYVCPGATAESEDGHAMRSYGINGGSDYSRETGDGISWSDGSRRAGVIVPGTFLMTERSLVDGWNRLGSSSNSIAMKQQHNFTPNFSQIDWGVHGNNNVLVYLFVDGSARTMGWAESINNSYWYYDE